MTDEDRELLRASQVADRLRVPTSTLADWRRRGIGPNYLSPEPGTRWVRYRRSDVEAWIAGRAHTEKQTA